MISMTAAEDEAFANLLQDDLATEGIKLVEFWYTQPDTELLAEIVVTDGDTEISVWASSPQATLRGLRRKRTYFHTANPHRADGLIEPGSLLVHRKASDAALEVLTRP